MTGTSNGRQTLATVGQVVFFLSLAVGVVLAAVAVWGVLEVRDQEAATGPDIALVDGQGVVPMTEGSERTLSIDGPSLDTALCTVTAPDGAVQTIEGFDPVGNARLGKRVIGDFSAEVGGGHQVQCSGVQEAWVSDESDPQRGSLLAIPSAAVVLLLVGVLPVAVISLVVWRMARSAGQRVETSGMMHP